MLSSMCPTSSCSTSPLEGTGSLHGEESLSSLIVGKVRLLTYNFFLRPPFIRTNASDHKNYRLKLFIKTILPQYDILALQEVFGYGSCRLRRLIAAAAEQGLIYSIHSPSTSLFAGHVDGGLLLLSRYPIVQRELMHFERGIHTDALSKKGAIYAKIQLPDAAGSCLAILTTHMQATPSVKNSPDDAFAMVRLAQLNDIKRLMMKAHFGRMDENGTTPLVILGDFNIDAHCLAGKEYQRMMSLLVDKLPLSFELLDIMYQKYGTHPITYGAPVADGGDAILTHKSLVGSKQCLDYIFLARPVPSHFTVDDKETKVQEFRVPDDPRISHMSDHYGASLVLRY